MAVHSLFVGSMTFFQWICRSRQLKTLQSLNLYDTTPNGHVNLCQEGARDDVFRRTFKKRDHLTSSEFCTARLRIRRDTVNITNRTAWPSIANPIPAVWKHHLEPCDVKFGIPGCRFFITYCRLVYVLTSVLESGADTGVEFIISTYRGPTRKAFCSLFSIAWIVLGVFAAWAILMCIGICISCSKKVTDDYVKQLI